LLGEKLIVSVWQFPPSLSRLFWILNSLISKGEKEKKRGGSKGIAKIKENY